MGGNIQHITQKLPNRHAIRTLSTFFVVVVNVKIGALKIIYFVLLASKFSVRFSIIFPTEHDLILRMSNLKLA